MFYPNGDNVSGIDAYDVNAISIFNKWGEVAFKSGSTYTPWDGAANGIAVPSGFTVIL